MQTKSKKEKLAFAQGAAFRLGSAYGKGKKCAQDAAKWITVKPNGAESKGRPALIDDETGRVIGGMGGKFTGKHISEAKSDKKLRSERDKQRAERRKQRQSLPEKLDFKNPEKIPADSILQNRDRSSVASQTQIHRISQDPDYDRLSGSREFGSGAPVVAFGSIPENQLGKKEWATMPDGTKYAVQYAVVEADKVLTSNDVHGLTNKEYYSDDPSKIRAIAGNGRVTGLTSAYQKGNAQKYNDDLYDDTFHGVDQNVIDRMKNPILVRVMQPKDVTKDIGDKSNVVGNIQMTAVEQARNDANRVDFQNIKTYSDGSPTKETISEFVKRMPESEQAGLIDKEGNPTRQALHRFNAAVFEKAYENEGLTNLYAQALDPDSKNIINALEGAASKMQELRDAGSNYDIRDIVSKAAMRAVNARREGINLMSEAVSQDLFNKSSENSAENMIIKLFADNARSPRVISEKLNKLADVLMEESRLAKSSMFGDDIPRDEIIKNALSKDAALSKGKLNTAALNYWKQKGGEFLDKFFSSFVRDKDFISGLNKL